MAFSGDVNDALRGSAVAPRRAFTTSELLTLVISVSILATLIIGAAIRTRDDGSLVGCVNHLRKLSSAALSYANINGGHLPQAGLHPIGGWYGQLLPYDGHFRSDALCPSARTMACGVGNAYGAWSARCGPLQTHGPSHPRRIAASYGINGHLAGRRIGRCQPYFPLFADCIWAAASPHAGDPMPRNLFLGNSSLNPDDQMGDFCIDRHMSAINVVDADGSGRPVRITSLWTLRWCRSFNCRQAPPSAKPVQNAWHFPATNKRMGQAIRLAIAQDGDQSGGH